MKIIKIDIFYSNSSETTILSNYIYNTNKILKK